MPQQLSLLEPLSKEETLAHVAEILKKIPADQLLVIEKRRQRRREQNKAWHKRWKDANPDYRPPEHRRGMVLPFAGVDGEGGGKDRHGRQNYLLLRAGEHELFNDNRPLSTWDCLDFILSLPPGFIYVGFYFTYDVTMIMKDIPYPVLETICGKRNVFDGKEKRRKSNFIYWGDYAIDFVPRQHFSVAKLSPDGRSIIEGSTRTINETGGFFQTSFVNVLKDWKDAIHLSEETFELIQQGKSRRESFVQLDRAEREYCRLECETLAQVMESLRDACREADLAPFRWRGAGWLASALHRQHHTPRRSDHHDARPEQLQRYEMQAYYGGRFEITAVGRIEGPVYEYDINSAYPAAMLQLPCTRHLKWKRFSANDAPKQGLYLARIISNHYDGYLCHLPCRWDVGLHWPRGVEGIYWSYEIEAARRAGADIHMMGGYEISSDCDCRPFDWVKDLYELRKKIGKSTRGYPIKLGINALYGKLAQRTGSRTYTDHLLAGLITAITRSWLIDAAREAPSKILMLATDGIYSRVPLSLPIGENIGQWEMKEHKDGMFIVQPGVYWFPGENRQPKSRGIPKTRIEENRKRFYDTWNEWVKNPDIKSIPFVNIDIPFFCPTRLGLQRKDRFAAGKWEMITKRVSFAWFNKRFPTATIRDGYIETVPYPHMLKSLSYDPDEKTDDVIKAEELAMTLEAAPDYAEPLME